MRIKVRNLQFQNDIFALRFSVECFSPETCSCGINEGSFESIFYHPKLIPGFSLVSLKKKKKDRYVCKMVLPRIQERKKKKGQSPLLTRFHRSLGFACV